MTTERIDGPTPAGGAYAVAFWTDERGVAVAKDRARRVLVVEYDAGGKRIAETHGELPAQSA